MNDYQHEQLEALIMVNQGIAQMADAQLDRLEEAIADYQRFRQSVDRFLNRYFHKVCTDSCYRSQTSACCSKDGIITFFADTVVNVLNADRQQLDRLERVLRRRNNGHHCVYLGREGCLWTVRPMVCAMFLCDRAMATVFNQTPAAKEAWEELRRQEKRFRWPDRPVLFDLLERVFIDLGYRSTLMHLNQSPGLLRIKRQAGLI